MASGPIASWQIDGEKVKTVANFIFLGSQITADGDCTHNIKTLAPWKKSYDKTCSVHFSSSVMSDSFKPQETQHARLPGPSPTSGVHPNPSPMSQWWHPTILSFVVPFSSCLNHSQHQGLFKWVSSSHQVAKLLEFQLQHQSFQWTLSIDLF